MTPTDARIEAASATSIWAICSFPLAPSSNDLRAVAPSGFRHVAITTLDCEATNCLTTSRPIPREVLCADTMLVSRNQATIAGIDKSLKPCGIRRHVPGHQPSKRFSHHYSFYMVVIQSGWTIVLYSADHPSFYNWENQIAAHRGKSICTENLPDVSRHIYKGLKDLLNWVSLLVSEGQYQSSGEKTWWGYPYRLQWERCLYWPVRCMNAMQGSSCNWYMICRTSRK